MSSSFKSWTVSSLFAALLVITASAGLTRAQNPSGNRAEGFARTPAPRPIAVHILRDGVYWTDGGPPSNTGFIVGTDGVIVFDPKGTVEAAKEVIADIAKITPEPITTVIVSHAHPDHTRGLPAYPPGINVIAQREAARQIELETFYMTWSPASAGDTIGGDKPYLPTQIVDKRAAIKINGVNIILLHWAPAHTAGDLVAYLPDQKIVFCGDIMGVGGRFENGGSVEGSIQAMQEMLDLDADIFVSGHAPVRTKAEMEKTLDEGIVKRDRVVSLWESGKTLEEAEQAMGEKVRPRPVPAIAGLPIYRAGRDMNFTEMVYDELSRN